MAVCTTGAYNYSMASNYNRLPRPPIVMLRGGNESYVAVRRESLEDLPQRPVNSTRSGPTGAVFPACRNRVSDRLPDFWSL